MRKRILSILLATTFVLTACGSSAEPNVSDVENVSSDIVEKETEATNTVASNKNTGSSGGSTSSSVTEANKEASSTPEASTPSQTEQTVNPTLEIDRDTTPAEPEVQETKKPATTNPSTTKSTPSSNTPSSTETTVTPSETPSDEPEKTVGPELDTAAENGTLSASVIMPSYTIAESTDLADEVVEQVRNGFPGDFYYGIYEDVNIDKPAFIVFVNGMSGPADKRDGNVYVKVNEQEYQIDVSDKNYDYFGEGVPMPDTDSRYVNFANGAIGFTQENDTIITNTYDAYLKIIASDGEMTDQDILDVINNIYLYTFTKEQALSSRYADSMKKLNAQ